MKKVLIAGLVVSGLIMASPTVASACPNQKSQCSKCAEKSRTCKISKLKKKIGLLWENKEDLGLKDGQLDKIKDIKHASTKKLIQLKADIEIVMVDLKSAMYVDSIDVDSVNKLIEAKYAAKEEASKTFIKSISDIQQVLSKDQRDQWKDLCKKSQNKASCSKGEKKFCPLTGKPLNK